MSAGSAESLWPSSRSSSSAPRRVVSGGSYEKPFFTRSNASSRSSTPIAPGSSSSSFPRRSRWRSRVSAPTDSGTCWMALPRKLNDVRFFSPPRSSGSASRRSRLRLSARRSGSNRTTPGHASSWLPSRFSALSSVRCPIHSGSSVRRLAKGFSRSSDLRRARRARRSGSAVRPFPPRSSSRTGSGDWSVSSISFRQTARQIHPRRCVAASARRSVLSPARRNHAPCRPTRGFR